VPQGAILSPLLFSIYINDIPLTEKNNKITSLLYADDLFSYYSDKNKNRLKIVIQRYLDDLQSWLNLWRLNMSATKCSYNVYGKTAKQAKLDLDLKLYGVSIPKESNPKYFRSYPILQQLHRYYGSKMQKENKSPQNS
jgi:hypothetical protein